MANKNKMLLLSSVTILSCISLIAAGTYALFTDSVTLTNHLEAGTLDITLKRTYLEWATLDDDGYLVTDDSDEEVDFTSATDRNIFDLSKDALIVPGCYYEATMSVENKSNVAFKYWIDVVTTSGEDSELAKQLSVTVTTYDLNNQPVIHDNNGAASLAEGISVGSATSPIGELAITDNAEMFKVKVAFDYDDYNNDAMKDKVSFDLIVNAVQVTAN